MTESRKYDPIIMNYDLNGHLLSIIIVEMKKHGDQNNYFLIIVGYKIKKLTCNLYMINELVRLMLIAGIKPQTLCLLSRCAIHYTNTGQGFHYPILVGVELKLPHS